MVPQWGLLTNIKGTRAITKTDLLANLDTEVGNIEIDFKIIKIYFTICP